MPLKIIVDEQREIQPPWIVHKPGVTQEEFLRMTTEDDRWELVDGEVIMHSPAPGTHEDLASWLIRVVGDYVELKGLGKVFPSNRSIHLATCRLVVPDVSFLSRARAGQESQEWIEAPVDWVCEIASKSSLAGDLGWKLDLYREHATGEAWVIDPDAREVHVIARRGRRYVRRLLRRGQVESSAIQGFWLDAGWLWARPLPSGLGSLKTILGVKQI